MRRARIPLRSIADSFNKSKPIVNEHKKLACTLNSFSSHTTFAGHDFFNYGVESTRRSIQMQIVEALSLGEKTRASNLLFDLGQGNCSLSAGDFLYIFRYCATAPDPVVRDWSVADKATDLLVYWQFVMETWGMMKEKKILLDNRCSLLMIKALCEGGCFDEALGLINFLRESHGNYSILTLYNCFLRACSKLRSPNHTNQCLGLMEQNMLGKNEGTYLELLKVAVWQQNISAVHHIWQDYIKNYSLNILPLRKFIRSFARLGDLNSAYDKLQQMVTLAIRGNSYVRKTAKGKLYLAKIDIPIPSRSDFHSKLDFSENIYSASASSSEKQGAFASDLVLSSMSGLTDRGNVNGGAGYMNRCNSSSDMKLLRWSFNDVIHASAHEKNCGLAKQLLLQMENLGVQPSSHTYHGILKAVISEGSFSDGIDVLKIMRQRNLKPYDSTLATLSICCSEVLELDLAEDLLEQVSHCPYPHPFNKFLAACDMMDQPERAIRILTKMKQLKLQPDIRTCELLFSLFGNVNVPYERADLLSQANSSKRISAIEMYMARNGVQHSHLSMKNLLKALGREGMIRKLLQYLHVAENLFCRNNTYLGIPIYNVVLHSLVKANESDKALEIFEDLMSSGSLPDTTTYNIMIDCCSIIKCFKSACALLSIMVRKGFSPETSTYTLLLKIVLNEDRFKEAFTIMDRACSEERELDVTLFNTILEKAVAKGRIDIIEIIVEKMRRCNVQPDTSTCSFVFSAYMEHGFHNTAVEALQVLSMRMLCGVDGIIPDITDYDDIIFDEGPESESQILKIFNDGGENLAVALLNLRWSAMLGFSVSQDPNGSSWSKKLSQTFDIEARSTLQNLYRQSQ